MILEVTLLTAGRLQIFDDRAQKDSQKKKKFVKELDDNSPASLKLEVLNQNGSIFLLLSGGGG